MFTFPRDKRLIKKSEFDEVFKKGSRVASAHFLFFYLKNNLHYARLGLAISKKKIPKSHDRHRVKRLIRETFRYHHTLGPLDIVVIVKQPIEREMNSTLMSQLDAVWHSLIG